MRCIGGIHARLLCGAQWRLLAVMSAAAAGLAATQLAQAQVPAAGPHSQPTYQGTWLEDTGQGAIEIASCPEGICGRIVWLKSPFDKSGKPLTDGNNPNAKLRVRPICGMPIIGALKRQRDGSLDEGWIYDPKQGKQFDVELRLRTADSVEVRGYLGVKLFGETFIWQRAPADLKRCA